MVKDEIALAEMIMSKPKIAMGHDAAKQIMGGGNTGPTLQPTGIVEEITERDVKAPMQRPQVTKQFTQGVRRDIAEADRIMGKAPAPLTEDMGFEQAVENLFECVNAINSQMDEYAGSAGRVSRKMEEKWQSVVKALQGFELYYDRTMQRL